MPTLKKQNNLTNASNPLVVQVLEFINENFHYSITLKDVAAALKYSPSYLTNFMKCQTGKTINSWIIERRLAEARFLLLETDQSIEHIAYTVGYQNVGYFFRQFRQHHETTPQAWRRSQLNCSSPDLNRNSSLCL